MKLLGFKQQLTGDQDYVNLVFFNLTLANTHGYPDRLDKSILFKEIILLSGIIQFCDLRGGQAALEINKVFTDWSSPKFVPRKLLHEC